jgi:hypothetical protein
MLSSGSPPVLGDGYISERFYSGRTQVQVADFQRERRIDRRVNHSVCPTPSASNAAEPTHDRPESGTGHRVLYGTTTAVCSRSPFLTC